jgi:glycosyltransferase involved in cell wall biosynthesis
MKVLHLSSERTWRGGEQQISYLMGVLKTHGVENFIAARSGSEMIRRHPEAMELPFKGEWDLWTAIKIKKIVRDHHIDLIHTHSGHGHTLGVLAAQFGAGVPVVVSKRTDYPVKNNTFSRWKFNHPSIARFLCVSDKIREIISVDLKNPALAKTVYSGIDMDRFPHTPSINIRTLAGIPMESSVVVSTAAISAQKDYGTFLKVAQNLQVLHPDLHFVICGEGPLEESIRAQAKDLGLEKNVHFLGFRKDLPQFLGSADAFLITSKEEGLGTSILDAFAVGLPVVATAAGGIPEIVKHSETGLLAPVGDHAMLATHVENIVYARGTLREKLIHNAHKLAQEFSFKRTGEKTLAIYQEILFPTA